MISSYAYTLDAAGNRTKVVEHSGRVVEYEYDDAYKLTTETIKEPGKPDHIISYTYDKVGNRKTKTENGFTTTYTYNDNNQLVTEDDITYNYDDNGNLKEKTSAEENIKYSYDAENHLTRVETTRFGVTITVEYEYDDEGNRVRKVIDGTVVINYLVDSNRDYAQVLEERDGNGNLLVRYVYGHDLISQTRSGATSYYHYDGLGSTRALTNGSEAVTDTYIYDAFGNLLDKTGTTTNTYLFTGEFFDANIGFYYLRARYMSPAIGRFITMDPFAGKNRDPYSLHKYLYAHANPVTYIDPSGYFSNEELLTTLDQRGRWEITAANAAKAAIPVWKKVVAGILVGLYIGASTVPYNEPPVMEARAYRSAAMLERIQLEVQIELGREDDSSGIRFYRGLSKLDLQEFYWYWLIFANGLRGPNPEYLGKDRKWSVSEVRTVLTEVLQNFRGLASAHAGGGSGLEKSPFVGVTTEPDIAQWFAHKGEEDDPTGGSSRHVLRVKTKRAIENPENSNTMIGEYRHGQAEWLIPLIIVRAAETLGEPFPVPPPTKPWWELPDPTKKHWWDDF